MDIGFTDRLSVVHFGEAGTEVISDVAVSADNAEITYEQGGFSVTGTIITGAPQEGKSYAIIVKKGDNYFTVFNDGTLMPANSAYDPNTNQVKVDMGYPLVWNYTGGLLGNGHYYYNLSIPSEAIDFYDNKLPTGYYNRYINATSDDGTTTEEEGDNTSDLHEKCAIWYNYKRLFGYDDTGAPRFIGLSADGTRIIGNQDYDNSVEIYLAETTVPGPDNATHDDHMVNHIDIAIAGNSTIKIPLAYGDYYDKDGNVIFTATKENHFIELTPSIPLSTNDMKRATITATAINDAGEREELKDVFYITGYSQNKKTHPDDLDQVRIEGSFKVSNIPHYDDADNNPVVCAERKQKPIDYTISVTKPITVEVEYNGQQLYVGGMKLVYENIPVTLSASFNYWQETNKCPALHWWFDDKNGFLPEWYEGKIVGGTGVSLPAMSGMDFDLGTVVDDDTIRKPAIEITKIIVDEEGNFISSTTSHDVNVDVYFKEKGDREEDTLIGLAVDESIDDDDLEGLVEGYRKLHTKNISVGTVGFGLVNDYDIQEGLIYIKEDEKSVDKYLTDTSGTRYQYVNTRIETEYAWRTDGDEGKTHNADGTTSVPEVLGYYLNQGQQYEGRPLDNTFLEFFVYNVYKPVELVDVPVDKNWPGLNDSYTWTADFTLEEIEVHESGPINQNANTTLFRKVEGVDPITITKGDTGNAITFKNLPKYRYYPDGSVYRIVYSVDETAYELKQDGTSISKWDKINGLTVGNQIYSPTWPHDAGDKNDEMHLSDGDDLLYHVIVNNNKKNEKIIETITNLKLQKNWEEESIADDPDAYATFQLKRYVEKEHYEYDQQQYDDTTTYTVTFIDHNNERSTITVKKGTKIYIKAVGKNNGNAHYNVTPNNIDFRPQIVKNQAVYSDPITVTQDLTIRCQGGGDCISEDSVSGGAGSEKSEDADFTNEEHVYTLNRANGWTVTIDNLPKYSEEDIIDYQQNVYRYSYYFAEIDCNPDEYSAVYSPVGGANNRITDNNTTVTATNKKVNPFYVEKRWHDVKDPDNYPEIRFTLYQGLIRTVTEYPNGVATQVTRVQEGSVFVGEDGKSYVDIPLNSDNGWTWKCPTYLPDKDSQGRDVGYYVVESTTGLKANIYKNSTFDANGNVVQYGEQITNRFGDEDIAPWDYYSSESPDSDHHSSGHGYTGTSGQLPIAQNGGILHNEGTLYIVNRAAQYIQFDVKKKWLEWGDDGSLMTTTSYPHRLRETCLKYILMRKTVEVGNSIDDYLVDWEEYGQPFYVGWDDSTPAKHFVEDPNNYGLAHQSDWFWQVNDSGQDMGLPSHGYYEKDDGTVVKVNYYYITHELGVYKNTNEEPLKEGYDWYVALLPQAWGPKGETRPIVFPMAVAQDQDRILNAQASDLEVDKDWTNEPDNVKEVYVKIYRQTSTGGDIEDFTADIANRTAELAVYGFVDDPTRLTTLENGVLVLGLTPETGGVLIHNVLMAPSDSGNLVSNYYEYWIEEVGYKDKDGNIYLTDNSTSATSTFFAEYDHSNSQGEWLNEWISNPESNRIKLSTKGNNKLRVKNHPTKDINVKKQWIDDNGNILDGPWAKAGVPVATSISFKMKRNDGQYLTFNGDPTLTIKNDGQRAVVRTATQDSSDYTVTYVPDSIDKADIGNWTTLIHGLQKYASDGTEYTYTVEEIKNGDGKPVDSDGNVIENCHTSVTGSGASFVIKNEKVDTSLSIEKTFEGDVELTDEQKQKITFTVTGPDFSKTFTYGVDTPGYTWKNGVLVIKDIQPGDYTVIETKDGLDVLFTDGQGTAEKYKRTVEGNTVNYVHTRKYTVGTTETTYQANATVVEGERTHVLITNVYNEQSQGALKLTKKVKLNGQDTDSELLNGDYSFTITGPGEQTTVNKVVVITVTNGTVTAATVDNEPVQLKDDYVVVEDLDEGTYVITETGIPAGMTLFSITGGTTGSADISNKEVTVQVTAGETEPAAAATADFTNNTAYVDVEIPGTKELIGGTPGDGAFEFVIERGDSTDTTSPLPTSTTVTNTGTGFKIVPIHYELKNLANSNGFDISKTFIYKIHEDQTGVDPTTHVENNILYDQTEITVTVTVSYDSSTGKMSYVLDKTATDVKFTNIPLTTVVADKSWLDVEGNDYKSSLPSGAKVTFGVYRDGAADPLFQYEMDGTPTAATDIPADGKDPAAYEDSAWHVTFKNLPKYKDDGSAESVYVVKETALTGVHGFTNQKPDGVDSAGTIINKQESTHYSVEKKWEGVTADTKDYVVQVQLMQQCTNNSDEPLTAYGDPVKIKKDQNGKWKYDWEALPKICPVDGKPYKYTVQEIGVYKKESDITENPSTNPNNLVSDFVVTVVENATTLTSTITNKLLEVHLLKVDKENPNITLGGAKFTLKKEEKGTYQAYPKDDETKNTKITPDSGTDKGKVSFSDLPVGKYELVEVEAPAGYAKLIGSIKFEIEADGTLKSDPNNNDQYLDLNKDTFLFTVQNEKGAALPSTGGIGTSYHYLLGAFLTLLAGSLMLLKRKRGLELIPVNDVRDFLD